MAVATPIPFVKATFFDRCGNVLAGGKVFTYEPRSTTPKVTYNAPISGTPNTNPVILDAAGQADIYLYGRYRIIVQDAKGVVVNDSEDIGSWYSGDLDSQLDSVNQYLTDSGDALVASQQQRIDQMVNTGLVGAGSTDLLVALSNGTGLTQKDKNAESISINDFTGTATAKFQAAFDYLANRGGVLLVPPGTYSVNTVTVAATKLIEVLAIGATIVPLNATGTIFNFGTSSIKWRGGKFDGTGIAANGQSIFLNSLNANLFELRDAEFLNPNYGALIAGTKSIVVDNITSNGARYWPVFVRRFTDCVLTRNKTFTGNYDGLKVGSPDDEGLSTESCKRLIIANNISGGNVRDAIDFAVNDAELVCVANNISDNDMLRSVDAKVVYQSTTGLRKLVICGNIANRDVTGDHTAINVQGLVGFAKVTNGIISNNVAVSAGNAIASAIRIADCENIDIFNNKSDGFYYAVRLTGASNQNRIFGNTAIKCADFLQSQSQSGLTPTGNKIYRNFASCLGHTSGIQSYFVRLDNADATEIYDNEYEVLSTVYPIAAENSGLSATNTKFGKNYRGFIAALPTGIRVVVGDTWRNSSPGPAAAIEWTCHTQASSSSTANMTNTLLDVITRSGGGSVTTDASGLVTITHNMGKAVSYASATVRGANTYIAKVITTTTTQMTVKCTDSAGAALVSASVYVDWTVST